MIFNIKQCFIPNSHFATVTSGVDWSKSFQRCRRAYLKLLYFFKILIRTRQGSPQWWP